MPVSKPDFIPKNNVQMETSPNGLRFTVTSAPPHDFRHKNAVTRSYIEAKGLYKLPLRIDMAVTIDAPGLCLFIGETGRVHFCSTWDDCRRIEDLTEIPKTHKAVNFANQMPLHIPAEITIIYNLKSMQILINGEQRYYSDKERYMKSNIFPELNAAGFTIRLSCHKRTEVTIHSFTITESAEDFEIVKQDNMPDPITSNIALRPGDKSSYDNIVAALGEKPTFDTMIINLPDEIRSKVIEVDAFLRSYKPLKFKRTLEKNGNKITYIASEAGVSYAIYLSRNLLTHSLQWYILTNSNENWGKRVTDDFVATLEKLAIKDAAFADRIFSYLHDCSGCYPHGMCRTPYTFKGETRQSCHGKIMFKMLISEFDDAMRLIQAIRG